MGFIANPKTESAALLLYQLARNKELHRTRATGAELPPELRLLRRWQSARLIRTYGDLIEDSRYQPAVAFFLHELYGDKDFSQRDHDIERVYPVMIRTLPASVLYSLAMAMELKALSYELDQQLMRVLVEEFDAIKHITEAVYAEGYRVCNNYNERKRQIELIGKLGNDLDKIVFKPYIYATLRLVRAPAQFAGFGEFQSFLEQGFSAFRHMRGADPFLNIIMNREMMILDRIYTGHPTPFQLDQ